MSIARKRLMRRIFAELEGERLVAFLVFLRESSIGDLAAHKLLREKGIERPWKVISQLIKEGWLEKGTGCVSLKREIRKVLAEEGNVLNAGRKLAAEIERMKDPRIRIQ